MLLALVRLADRQFVTTYAEGAAVPRVVSKADSGWSDGVRALLPIVERPLTPGKLANGEAATFVVPDEAIDAILADRAERKIPDGEGAISPTVAFVERVPEERDPPVARVATADENFDGMLKAHNLTRAQFAAIVRTELAR